MFSRNAAASGTTGRELKKRLNDMGECMAWDFRKALQ